MGWFDGFPFVSKEERERRKKDFDKRIAPFGIEEQREKLKSLLKELFPKVDIMDSMFVFYDAKDSYTKRETPEEGIMAARLRLKRTKWVDARSEAILLRLIELEVGITSLDEYPTAQDVLKGL